MLSCALLSCFLGFLAGLALVLAMAFYFSMNMVSLLDKFPELRPDLMLWIPNILFQVIGLVLCYRFGRS